MHLGEIQINTQCHRGRLVRQFRTLGVVAVVSALGFVGYCLKFPGSRVRAQNQSAATSSAPLAAAVSSRNVPATIAATGISSRSLAVAPVSASAADSAPITSAPSVLYLNSSDRANELFSFAVAQNSSAVKAVASVVPERVPTFTGASIPSSVSQLPVVAGSGVSGSLGDGGQATSAEFNLNAETLSFRSGVAVAQDGTVYIADTNNSTIRSIAGPSSTEPGIVRSIAGRFASSQNVQLSQPLGIALDRAGNLYIADRSANAVDVLYGSGSSKAGQLETLAQFKTPSDLAVTPDGRTLYVASADTGAVAAINTQTRAIRDAGIVPASLFPAGLVKSSSVRILPQGLATDGAGNLFVSYALTNANTSTSAAAGSDQILRLDAFTAKVTVSARGLSEPGEIAFDVNGNLFVSNQTSRQILKFAALGVPATGVALTPPGGAGTVTDFGDVPVGGSTDATALQSFELSNNTSAALTNVVATTATGNTGDFTVANTSCTSTLAAGQSCNFNVSFTPTQNATTACSAPATSQERCTNLSVTYNGAATPLTAALTGTADNFDIQCVSTASVICIPSAAGGTVQITIPVGLSATYQFQIAPDSIFSGPVTVICPSDLPASPVGTASQPTTCGISAGTTVTEPLVSSLVINVTAGTPAPFNVTIQTTDSAGRQCTPGGTCTVLESQKAMLISASPARNGGGPTPPAAPASESAATASKWRNASPFLIGFVAFLLLSVVARFATCFLRGASPSRRRALIPVFAFFTLLVLAATIVGCHHTTSPAIGNTPQGTYNLTVTGSAQNASRGYTMTLVVD